MRQLGLSGACLALCLLLAVRPGHAAEPGPPLTFQVPPGQLASALASYTRQSGEQLIYRAADVQALKTRGISGTYTPGQALALLLRGTGLKAQRDVSGAVALTPEPKPAAAPPARKRADHGPGDDAQSVPEDLGRVLVTAQKRVERIQDVPMSVSVFGGETLRALRIEGGSELVRGAPGTTFSKTNFTTHNFQIRGVGSQALSASVDSGVAINFNGMPLARNRFYEQEYFDVDRVELLRGPQGTLHSRNATAGVIDMIPRLPEDSFEADLGIESGSYGLRRISGMVNVPLADDWALRLAGVHTSRDGIDYNTFTRRHVNNRDLWGGRASLRWTPSETFEANLIWEHFSEADQRARTGKQLCRRDPGPERIGEVTLGHISEGYRSVFSQGCLPVALNDERAFQAPDGMSLPAFLPFRYFARNILGVVLAPDGSIQHDVQAVEDSTDPFGDIRQSRNLREIATEYDPRFRAKNDLIQLHVDAQLNDELTVTWQTGWSRDQYWSTQDYNRFPSGPSFGDTTGAINFVYYFDGQKLPIYPLLPGGVFTDPQLGPARGLRSADLSRSRSKQWWHEFRLQSSFDGIFNFQAGANYLRSKVDEDYFIFNNFHTLYALLGPNKPIGDYFVFTGFVDCPPGLSNEPNAEGYHCVYIDPNPIDRLDGQGHNYFRSRSLVETRSLAAFGEANWRIGDSMGFTVGARYTRDVKLGTPVPSQLLLSPGSQTGGMVYYGYPRQTVIRQQWEEGTGRLVFDWKPVLGFTDETLLYASFARGYKAGGLNSPGIDADRRYLGIPVRDPRYQPESVNALEFGIKNTLLDGRLTLNASGFSYRYRNYQVSKYVDRSVLTENFDARTWGIELEAQWRPAPEWRLDLGLGYLRTRIDDGQDSIDVMDRTYGQPDWVLLKPWYQLAANCIAPTHLVAKLVDWMDTHPLDVGAQTYANFCTKNFVSGREFPAGSGIAYDPATYPDVGQHRGEGFATPLGGKELPNAPRFTVNIGVQRTFTVGRDWDMILRADYYRQSASWARVYNAVNDRLRGWDNVNLSLTLAQPRLDFAVELYVKNLFDRAPITGTFINGDDSGLTTNVFTLDPRVVGLSVRKRFF